MSEEHVKVSNNRIKWVDVARFIGMYSIYIFHFGEESKNAYAFTYVYCVPIFFFLSGCMANLEHETEILPYIKKKFMSLMVPFYMFSLMAITVHYLVYNPDLSEVDNILHSIIAGAVRNHYFSPALWFLTCLFVMEIMFFFIKKLKNKIAISAVCFAMYLIANLIIKPNPAESPSWWYNLDSAILYIFYYGIGFVVYPYIARLFLMDKTWKKAVVYISSFVTFCYSFLLYEELDLIHVLGDIPGIVVVFPIIRAAIVIWFILCLAKYAEHIEAFSKLGEDTLYLCGSEQIIKEMLPYIIGVFGLSVNVYYPIQIFIYSMILMLITEKFLVPVEKKMRNGFKAEKVEEK